MGKRKNSHTKYFKSSKKNGINLFKVLKLKPEMNLNKFSQSKIYSNSEKRLATVEDKPRIKNTVLVKAKSHKSLISSKYQAARTTRSHGGDIIFTQRRFSQTSISQKRIKKIKVKNMFGSMMEYVNIKTPTILKHNKMKS
mmetsp:Transcript_17167/g.19197  ORF Transcript_17167/g.19197 Transcript_17167/m.19197 type:complete len:140 (+) Transcript_17167:537-956(+)